MARSPRNSKAAGVKATNIYDGAREAPVSVFTVSAVINKKGPSGFLVAAWSQIQTSIME
jgi:hypothetical protein